MPAAQAKTLTTRDIVERSEMSVAQVRGFVGSGTGFLVDKQLLVTNAHVIEYDLVHELKAYFPSAANDLRGPYGLRIAFKDLKRDLALLSVDADLPPLKLAQSYIFRKGDDVTIIGSPGLGGAVTLQNAITRGVLSTDLLIEGRRYYQLGASVNSGNSGGPVLSMDGTVIGVVVSKANGVEAVSFCIPIEELAKAVTELGPPTAEQMATVVRDHDLQAIYRRIVIAGRIYRAALHSYINSMDKSIKSGRTAAEGALAAANDREVQAANINVNAHLEDRILPTLSTIAKDRQVAEGVRRDLAELWAICTDMRSYINQPRGSYTTYVEKVRELEDKFDHLVHSLRILIGN